MGAESTAIVTHSREELAQLKDALFSGRLDYTPDPEAIARDIARRIMEAETPEEVAHLNEATGAEDLLGVTLVVRSFRANPSTKAEGLPFYLVLDAVREDTGEKVTVTTGSVNVVATMLRALEKGWLPLRGLIKRAEEPSSSGTYPQWFIPEAVGVDATG